MQNDCMALGFRTVCLLLDGEILFLVFEMREIEYNFKIFICCVPQLLLCTEKKLFNFCFFIKSLSCLGC